MKIKKHNAYNYNPKDEPNEKVIGPSLTIPDDAYTIQELLNRHAEGMMPPIENDPQWEEYPDIDSPNPLRQPDADLTDLQSMGESLQRVVDNDDDSSSDPPSESEPNPEGEGQGQPDANDNAPDAEPVPEE